MPETKKPIPAATEKQLDYLSSLGVIDIPADLNVAQASKLIEETLARRTRERMAAELATMRQVEHILELGGKPWDGMTKAQASDVIGFLHEHQPECPKCRSSVHAMDTRCGSCGGFLSPETVWHPGPDEIDMYAPAESPAEERQAGSQAFRPSAFTPARLAAPGVCPSCGAMTDLRPGTVTVTCQACGKLFPADPGAGGKKGWLSQLFGGG